MPRIDEDIVPILLQCAKGTIPEIRTLHSNPQSAVSVISCAKGYPAKVENGNESKIK
jgi:phosphoribosylamine-glycine ligase